jgi:hypothetical protein
VYRIEGSIGAFLADGDLNLAALYALNRRLCSEGLKAATVHMKEHDSNAIEDSGVMITHHLAAK